MILQYSFVTWKKTENMLFNRLYHWFRTASWIPVRWRRTTYIYIYIYPVEFRIGIASTHLNPFILILCGPCSKCCLIQHQLRQLWNAGIYGALTQSTTKAPTGLQRLGLICAATSRSAIRGRRSKGQECPDTQRVLFL